MYGDEKVKVTNAYKYLGMAFTTKLCLCFQMYVKRGKKV